MSHKIILALGTNANPDYIKKGISALRSVFNIISVSETIETEALGDKFHDSIFFNALAVAYTDKTHIETNECLKRIEKECGNSRILREKGKVVLDIDLLKHDEQRFHEIDWERTYIKNLLITLKENK